MISNMGHGITSGSPRTVVSLTGGLISSGSQDLSSVSVWTVQNGSSSVGGQVDPNLGLNAYLITEGNAGTTSYGLMGVNAANVTITGSTATTGGIWVKAGTCTWFRLILDDLAGTSGVQAWFNLGTGAKGTLSTFAGTPTGTTSAISAVQNGFYFCSISTTIGASVNARLILRMVSADNTSTDAGLRTMYACGPRITQP